MRFIETRHPNGVVTMSCPLLPVRHAFTTRFGGVSRGVFASLNLGETRGDDPESVRENYRRLGEATGIDTVHMAYTKQVHGNAVRIVTAADARLPYGPLPYEADGIVTAERGLTLICYGADCITALLCDEKNGVTGAVHCGWRSSVADILSVALEKMRSLGAEASHIRAALGPSLGDCCFEVGPEVVEAVRCWLGDPEGLYRKNPVSAEEKYFLDLSGANTRRLVQLGLAPEHIAVSGECTRCLHDKYWSHRWTKGRRGVQAALIRLETEKG